MDDEWARYVDAGKNTLLKLIVSIRVGPGKQ